jgi:hypothetical protein
MGPAHSGRGCSPVLNGLEALLRETHFAWSLDLIGEDQAGKLATLTGDLRRGFSMTGDGKRITSGFSYLGTEPAIAWANACRDRLYPVMKQSIDSLTGAGAAFEKSWATSPTMTLVGGQGTARRTRSSSRTWGGTTHSCATSLLTSARRCCGWGTHRRVW